MSHSNRSWRKTIPLNCLFERMYSLVIRFNLDGLN